MTTTLSTDLPTPAPTPTPTAATEVTETAAEATLHEEATAATAVAVFQALADPEAALRRARERQARLAIASRELAAWVATRRCVWCLSPLYPQNRNDRCSRHLDGWYIAGYRYSTLPKTSRANQYRKRPTRSDQFWRGVELSKRQCLAYQVTQHGGTPAPCPYPEDIPGYPGLARSKTSKGSKAPKPTTAPAAHPTPPGQAGQVG